MARVPKRRVAQKKSATKRTAAEKKRLEKVQKEHGGKKKTAGVDTVVVRKPKVTRKKTAGGMKTKKTARGDFISGKTGKIEKLRG